MNAQEKMARWAFWMTVAAFASVLLTAVGVFLIYRTLVYTRRAVEEARKTSAVAAQAAEAALNGNKLNREMFIAEQRAWIPIRQQDIKIVSPMTWNNGEMRVEIKISTRNSGLTPAYKVGTDMEGTLNIFPRQPVERIARITRIEAIAQSRRILFPEDTFNTGGACVWTKDMLEAYSARFAGGPHVLEAIFLFPRLIVCFDYGVVSEQDRRSTIFVVDIIRITNRPITLADCPIPTNELMASLREVIAD